MESEGSSGSVRAAVSAVRAVVGSEGSSGVVRAAVGQ